MYAENLRDRRMMSKRAQLAESLEIEDGPLAAVYGGRDIDRNCPCLSRCVLRGWRHPASGLGLDGRAVSQDPHPAFVALQLELGVSE